MVIAQVPGFSFCVLQLELGSAIWPEVLGAIQITLGALMTLLVAIQFIKQSLQMYRVTKQFELNRYMNLLAREGMFYFLAYVHVSPSHCLFLLASHQADSE